MKKLCVFCVLCLVCLCELRAGDTVRVSIWDRLWKHRSVVASFIELSYRNPAVRYDRYSSSLTRATVDGQYTSESEPVLLQSGDGEKSIGFQADSYIRKKNYCLWGNALYRNGRVKNLKWNETSDWELLYPYLLADSVGGDLSKEIYSFTGGYAARYESITWGGDFSYEASVAYRGIDPRPKNTTSDLSLSLGLSIPVSPSYLFDISVSGRKYKQTNGIKFYSELGVSKVYHLTGLGMHYNRFAGNNYSTYYNGYEWGGSLGVHTSRSTGFVGNVAYRYFSCEKIISSLNELPMARIGRHTFAGEWLYRKSLSGIESWGIKLTGNYELKLGTENIFGDAANQIYPKIGEAEQYSSHAYRLSLSGFYEAVRRKGWNYSVQPRVNYGRVKAEYVYPLREMSVREVTPEVALSVSRMSKDWFLRLEIGGNYAMTFDSRLFHTPSSIDDAALLSAWCYNYKNLSSDYVGYYAVFTCSRQVGKKYLLQLDLKGGQYRYNTDIVATDVCAGLSFLF